MTEKKKKSGTKKAPHSAPEKRAIRLTEGSAKARRSAARLAAVQVLYQMELNEQTAKDALRDFVNNRLGFEIDGDIFVPADQDLLDDIVKGVVDRRADIDGMILGAMSKPEKTDPLLAAILSAGTWELVGNTKTDAPIIISDYLNVTAAFYEGNEPKLVNAVLDKIAKTVRS